MEDYKTDSRQNERIATLEQKCRYYDDTINKISSDVKEIKDVLLRRPSWFITILITALVTVTTSLIIFIVTR